MFLRMEVLMNSDLDWLTMECVRTMTTKESNVRLKN